MSDVSGEYERSPDAVNAPPAVVAPPAEQLAERVRDLANEDVPCRNCGFNLRGLTPEGNCPECGAAIWRSIREDKLIYCGEAYLKSLYRGLVCILIAAIGKAALTAVGIAVGIVVVIGMLMRGGGTVTPSPQLNVISNATSLPFSLLMLYGWWLLSAPDPGQRTTDSGQKPRIIVRTATAIQASTAVLVTVCYFFVLMVPAAEVAAMIVGLIGGAAWTVQFFASMYYLRWLAPRIPSTHIDKRAQLYIWLLPVIFVTGFCVLGIGPLVATIMYFLLLNDVRVKLKEIIQRQHLESASTDIAESAV